MTVSQSEMSIVTIGTQERQQQEYAPCYTTNHTTQTAKPQVLCKAAEYKNTKNQCSYWQTKDKQCCFYSLPFTDFHNHLVSFFSVMIMFGLLFMD